MDPFEFLYLIIFCFWPAFANACDNLETLSSISVVFRHGDRTPEPYPVGFYPNDPYRNDPMEPVGHGGLTNQGKRREYEFGLKLRERYNKFLGDIYKSQDVSALSTDYDRTKMSLSLVLAGLYPPKSKQVWKSSFNWQPIPITWVPKKLGGLASSYECPTFKKELQTVLSSIDYQKDLSNFHTLMENLTSLIGREVSESHTVLNLYHTLIAENAMDLELPKWAKHYFPNGPMKNATLFEYQTRSYTSKLKKLNGGLILRKVLNAISSNKRNSGKKVQLYSAHDTTVVALLQALDLWNNDIPEYGSAIVLELHKCDGKDYLKIVHYKGIPPIFETRIIPGCSKYCSMEDFLNILKDVIPEDVVETCFGPPNDSLLIPKSENPVEWFYGKLKEWYNV